MKDENSPEKPKGEPTDNPPLPSDASVADKSHAETAADAQNKSHSNLDNYLQHSKACMTPYEFTALVISALTLSLVAVTATVYYCQLREMQKSTDAAVRAANAAEKTLDSSNKSFRLDQRAWLGIERIQMTPVEPGKSATIQIILRNYGKTIARMTSCIGYTFWATGNAPIDLYTDSLESSIKEKIYYPAPAAGTTIFPNSGFTVTEFSNEKITPDQISNMKAGRLYFQIVGHVTYDDVFGGRHTTNFFVHYDISAGSFVLQNTHNDAD